MEPILFRHALVVDANQQHQKVISVSLGRLIDGIKVSVYDTEAGLWPDENYNWNNIDLVLVDVGDDKVKLKAWFSSLLQKMDVPPVIFLDRSASVNDAVEMMRLGAVDYLDKRGLKDSRLQQSLQTAWKNRNTARAGDTAERIREASEEADQLVAEKLREVEAAGGYSDSPDSDSFQVNSGTDDSSVSWFKLPSISDDFPFTPEDIEAGKAIVGNYRVLEFLGVGSSTQVFKVEAMDTKELFAIKILSPGMGSDKSARERFIRGYELVRDLDHPHIIKTLEQNTEGQWPFMIMEYCSGGDLQSRMKQKVSKEKAIEYVSQIASGLDGASAAGLVHRDINPNNILFRQDDTLVLVDFGIVKKQTTEEQAMTDEGKMVGTPYYMSPEQARGGKLDGRSDLYALGVILFEMLEGKRPFTGDTAIDVIFAHVQDPIPRLSEEYEEMNDVVGRLLAKDRDERFATGLELIKALKKLSPKSVDDRLLTE